jgi:Na(+)/H(+) exchange regulatory cofactor NHE-RF1
MSTEVTVCYPRLCHLRKWSHFQGYGFNLHAEKTRNGQFIGKVDANSPAESAGLKEKDRIIEVNFVNISNENHQQVVKRIRNGVEIGGKLIENEVVLLVVDQETDDYLKKNNIIIKHDMPEVLRLETKKEESNGDSDQLSDSSPQPSSKFNENENVEPKEHLIEEPIETKVVQPQESFYENTDSTDSNNNKNAEANLLTPKAAMKQSSTSDKSDTKSVSSSKSSEKVVKFL